MCPRASASVLAPLLAAAVFLSAAAETIHVPADEPTVQDGLNAAGPGDIVLVAPGTYFERNVQLATGVTLESSSGAEATVLDAEGVGSCVLGAEGATIRGFTIRNSGIGNTGGVYCYQATTDIFDCILTGHRERSISAYRSHCEIRGNRIYVDTAISNFGIFCVRSGVNIAGNQIFAEDPNDSSDAIYMSSLSVADAPAAYVDDNKVIGGVSIGDTGPGTLTAVRSNVFSAGEAHSSAVGMASCDGEIDVSGNTIVDGAGVFLQSCGYGSSYYITNNIIAGTTYGIDVFGTCESVVSNCNAFWENGQNYGGVTPGPADFDADPQFCDVVAGDFHLMDTSPCLPGNHPSGVDCGLIGAYGDGCAGSPVREATWGRVKALYR